MVSYYIRKIFRKFLLGSAIKNSQIHKTSKIGIGCNVVESSLGKHSYVGDYTNLSMVEVGSFVSISSNCSIGGGAHPIVWVSTSPVFTDTRSILRKNLISNHFNTHKPTYIGNDVWIGTHVLIKAGIHVGDGAIIGMGSVVTKDIGAYEIWAGNPARYLRKRFSDDDIRMLVDIKWWEMEDDYLKEAESDICDVKKFIERYYHK